MSKGLGDLGASGLQFFGTITASISHEIKNVLAIISENAGLLSDLSLMAKKGKPIDIERVEKIAATLLRVVKRADNIVKSLNTFAHSIDHQVSQIDLRELVSLAGSVFARPASMRGITLVPVQTEEPLMITTHCFFLEQLVWRCVNFAMDAVGVEGTVRIIPERCDSDFQIRFTGLENLKGKGLTDFPSDREQEVIAFLDATVSSNVEKGELVFFLPRKLER